VTVKGGGDLALGHQEGEIRASATTPTTSTSTTTSGSTARGPRGRHDRRRCVGAPLTRRRPSGAGGIRRATCDVAGDECRVVEIGAIWSRQIAKIN
jgi:hypothetical protein